MEIKRSGSQLSAKGPADWFTGTLSTRIGRGDATEHDARVEIRFRGI